MSCCSTDKNVQLLRQQITANYQALHAEIEALDPSAVTPEAFEDLVSDVEALDLDLDAEVLARTSGDSSLSSRLAVFENVPFTVVTTDAQLRAALLVGGTIFVKGNIVLIGRITIGVAGTRLLGFGTANSSITLQAGTGATAIIYVNAVDVLVQDLKIVGNVGSSGVARPSGFVWDRTAHRTTIRFCDIRTVFDPINLRYGGVAASENYILKDLTVEDNYLSDYTGSGMYIEGELRRVHLNRNKILATQGIATDSGSGNGIWIGLGIENIEIRDNYIRDVTRIGIEIFYPDAIWDKVTGGIGPLPGRPTPYLTNDSTYAGPQVIVSGNILYNVGSMGISCTGSSMAKIVHNQVRKFKFIGIECIGEGNSTTPVNSIDCQTIIANNSVREGSVSTPSATLAGISVGFCQYVMVANNHVEDVDNTNSSCSGIYIYDGYNNTVINNQCVKAGSFYIRCDRTTDTIVRDNVFRAKTGEAPTAPLSAVYGLYLITGNYTAYGNTIFPNATATLESILLGIGSSVVLSDKGAPARVAQANDGNWSYSLFNDRTTPFTTVERRIAGTGAITVPFGLPGNLVFTFQVTVSGASADGAKVASFIRRGTIKTRSRPPATWQILNQTTVGTDYETDSTSDVTFSIAANVFNVIVTPPTGETWNWGIKIEGMSAQYDPA
jgi:hypothetical protein